jgi:heme A synthase
MRRTRIAAAAAATATWVLIVVGGYVRVTGSGMGCPDWPRCHGQWLPPDSLAAIIEVTHRYAAGTVSLLVLIALTLAYLSRKEAPGPWRAILLAAVLIVIQIGLGAWTVMTANRGDTVVIHLLTALATLGALTWAAVPPGLGRVSRPAALLVGSTLALAAVGGAVQVTNGGFLCPEFPLCGSAWPSERGTAAELHMVHRMLALVTGVVLGGVVISLRRGGAPRRAWRLGVLAVCLFATQALIGVAQVSVGMPPGLRWAHLVVGAAFWGCTVALTAADRGWPARAQSSILALPAARSSGVAPWEERAQ